MMFPFTRWVVSTEVRRWASTIWEGIVSGVVRKMLDSISLHYFKLSDTLGLLSHEMDTYTYMAATPCTPCQVCDSTRGMRANIDGQVNIGNTVCWNQKCCKVVWRGGGVCPLLSLQDFVNSRVLLMTKKHKFAHSNEGTKLWGQQIDNDRSLYVCWTFICHNRVHKLKDHPNLNREISDRRLFLSDFLGMNPSIHILRPLSGCNCRISICFAISVFEKALKRQQCFSSGFHSFLQRAAV